METSWFQKIGFDLFAETWSEDRPSTTPDGLADPEAALKALKEASQEVIGLYGTLDVPWGDVFRLKYEVF